MPDCGAKKSASPVLPLQKVAIVNATEKEIQFKLQRKVVNKTSVDKSMGSSTQGGVKVAACAVELKHDNSAKEKTRMHHEDEDAGFSNLASLDYYTCDVSTKTTEGIKTALYLSIQAGEPPKPDRDMGAPQVNLSRHTLTYGLCFGLIRWEN